MSEEAPPLAQLHEGLLDSDQLSAVLADIEAHTIVDIVFIKGGAAQYAQPGPVTFEVGRDAFVGGHVRGLQVRYLWNDDEWWDTFMRLPDGVRLVRMKQDYK